MDHSSFKSKLPLTGTTIFTVMSSLAAEHGALNLSQGFPDFPINDQLIELSKQAMKDGHNQYAPMQGLPALRNVIAEKYSESYGITVDPDQEITVAGGATEALYSVITALVKTGDEVIIMEPSYDSYEPTVVLNGGVPVPIPLAQPDFHVDWERVRAGITDKTRLIILNSPHNPTGAVLKPGDLRELERIVEEHDLYILSDEVYEHLIFDGNNHQSMLCSPVLRARSACVYSFGKTFHATGWKVGYAIAPEWMTKEIQKVHQFLTFSVNTPIQHALSEFLKEKSNYNYLPGFFQGKRDLFLNVVKSSRFVPVTSSGTYFQLLSYRNITEEGDFDLATRLTREFKIASIPISVFYHNKKDDKLLRFCFAKQDETLEQAGEILCRI